MKIEAKTIHVMGDMHGEVDLLNYYIDESYPEVLILLGDCGFFWTKKELQGDGCFHYVLDTYAFDNLQPKATRIFWLAGNHDHWDHLDFAYGRNTKGPIEIKPNVYYCPIGSQLTINNKNCLFVGGAFSIDKAWRTEGISWWSGETLTDKDFKFIEENVESVDIVFSHTIPNEWEVLRQSVYDMIKFTDPSREVLSKILNKYKPNYWFAGHWHRYRSDRHEGTEWTVLNTFSPGLEDGGRFAIDISGIFEEMQWKDY